MDGVDGFLVTMLQKYLQVCVDMLIEFIFMPSQVMFNVNFCQTSGPEPTAGQSALATSDSVSDRESVRVYHNLVSCHIHSIVNMYLQ
jgi:hypothetical protein